MAVLYETTVLAVTATYGATCKGSVKKIDSGYGFLKVCEPARGFQSIAGKSALPAPVRDGRGGPKAARPVLAGRVGVPRYSDDASTQGRDELPSARARFGR